jgi:hypothetical protein
VAESEFRWLISDVELDVNAMARRGVVAARLVPSTVDKTPHPAPFTHATIMNFGVDDKGGNVCA